MLEGPCDELVEGRRLERHGLLQELEDVAEALHVALLAQGRAVVEAVAVPRLDVKGLELTVLAELEGVRETEKEMERS